MLYTTLVPQGVDGHVTIMADHPDPARGGIELGSFDLRADMPQEVTEVGTKLSKVRGLKGKHAVFYVFESDTREQSLCELHYLVFTKGRKRS